MANQKQLEGERYLAPAVDIYETKDNVVLLVDLPGVSKEGLSLSITKDELTIKGEMDKGISKDEEVLYGEMNYGDYYRVFTLSDVLDREKVSAKLDNGVLELTLPKAEHVKPREIPISYE